MLIKRRMIVNYNEASTWGDMVYTDVMTKIDCRHFLSEKNTLKFCMEEMFKREEMFEK